MRFLKPYTLVLQVASFHYDLTPEQDLQPCFAGREEVLKDRYHPLIWAGREFEHSTLVFLVVVVLLTLGFYRNQWHAAGSKRFYEWRDNSDVMLVARLVWSRQHGIFSDAALLGLGDGEWPMTEKLGRYQYDTYFENGGFGRYWAYRSVIGAQGILFSAVDQLTGLPGSLNLKIFRGMTALLSATAIALIVRWFQLEWGSLPALFVLLFSMLSEWLTLYGASIYWQLWALFLPAMAIGAYLHRVKETGSNRPLSLVLICTGAVLIKTAFNGFEFITTVLGMMLVPVVYYALSEKWNIKAFLVAAAQVAAGAGAGTLLGLGILARQVAAVEGGWDPAITHILYTLGKRATGDPTQYSGAIAQSLKAETWPVIWKYIGDGRAMDLGNWVANPQLSRLRQVLEIQYFQVFILFILASLLFFIFAQKHRLAPAYRKTLILCSLTWLSILPPLSWLVFFKAHAYIHTNLDYIVWQMPFTLVGFAFLGMVIQYLLSLGRTSNPDWRFTSDETQS